MQISPTRFLVEAEEADHTTFRIYVENVKKGAGTFSASIVSVETTRVGPMLVQLEESEPAPESEVETESADAEPEADHNWTLTRMGPGDSWDLSCDKPIKEKHLIKIQANGSPGIIAVTVEVRPKTAEEKAVEAKASEKAADHRDAVNNRDRKRRRGGRNARRGSR